MTIPVNLQTSKTWHDYIRTGKRQTEMIEEIRFRTAKVYTKLGDRVFPQKSERTMFKGISHRSPEPNAGIVNNKIEKKCPLFFHLGNNACASAGLLLPLL